MKFNALNSYIIRYGPKYTDLNIELHIDSIAIPCVKNRLQHCLEWVMRVVYTSKLTPDTVVTYLFHDCERNLWLFCLVWHVRVMIKVQYTSTDR